MLERPVHLEKQPASVDDVSSVSHKLFERREDAAWPRILPFALFMAFIMLNALLQGLGTAVPALAPFCAVLPIWLYPVRIAVVLAILIYAWPAYQELAGRVFTHGREMLLAVGIGVIVYLAWVQMEWPWATQGQPTGYNPFEFGAGFGVLLAGVRLFGATVVVPVMEELFWRSWLIRYLISPHFTSVRLATFTPLSCIATVVVFGLEHHLWLAGIMAGGIYTLLLYKTRRLWPCIVAHAITNLLLGVHVLATEEWRWW